MKKILDETKFLLSELSSVETSVSSNWHSNAAFGRELASRLGKGFELQGSPQKRGGITSFRIRMNQAPNTDVLKNEIASILGISKENVVVSSFVRDSIISGRYSSSRVKIVDELGEHIKTFAVTSVTSGVKHEGGISGPGENELVDAILSSGASIENPIDIDFGGTILRNVTGAVKPSRSEALGGEPKIDVLILGEGGRAHQNGALSLKLATGAPSYAGWSRIQKFVPSAKKEISDLVDEYLKTYRPEKVPGETNMYRYVKNYAKPVSDDIAFFSIYGSKEISGGLKYGKNTADHVVSVKNTLNFDLKGRTLFVSGYKFYEKHDLFRGTEWEPFWLIRGARDRNSGVDKIIVGCRIVVAPEKRARKYIVR